MDFLQIQNLIKTRKSAEAVEIVKKLRLEFQIPALSPNYDDLLASYSITRAKCYEKFFPSHFSTSFKDSSFIALR